MSPFDCQFWRAAGHLERFLKNRADNALPDPPNGESVQRLRALTDRLQIVEQRGLQGAAKSVAMALQGELWRCQSRITAALELLSARFKADAVPTQALLYAELVALTTEFAECEVDLRQGTLSVTTESIVLEDVDLGSFQIILDWKSNHTSTAPTPYMVKALDPCTPESRSHITHPHVMNDRLCEGEAKSSLRRALHTGRLTDFFQIINQVLHTYNRSSPYASLDEWTGTTCQDCGSNTSSDCSRCSGCRSALCDDCGSACSICDTTACESCLRLCPQCESQYCSACATDCQECGRQICSGCLNSANQLCQECDDVSASETCEPGDAPATREPETELTVQPAGLGQIAVPA